MKRKNQSDGTVCKRQGIKCDFASCESRRRGGSNFCRTHAKDHDPWWFNKNKCQVQECKKYPANGSFYCARHGKTQDKQWVENVKCQIQGCTSRYVYGTTYCRVHAKQFDKAWSDAHQEDQCATCTARRCFRVFNGKSSAHCLSCASIHDVEWYKMYKLEEKCIHCHNQRDFHAYEGISTKCCLTCCREKDPKWAKLHDAALKCANPNCNNTHSTSVYEGKRSMYCVSCSRLHDPSWRRLYELEHKCENCSNQRCSTVQGQQGRFCLTCSKTLDPQWYQKYCSIMKCANCPTMRNCHSYGGRTTLYCIDCSSSLDIPWFTLYKSNEKCVNANCTNRRSWKVYNDLKTQHCVTCSAHFNIAWHRLHYQRYQCSWKSIDGKQCESLRITKSDKCTIHQTDYIATKVGTSKAGCKFIDDYAAKHNVTVQHTHYDKMGGVFGKEYEIDSFKVDGFIQATNTVIEFHGDYWHGNPTLFDSTKTNANTGTTFGTLYKNTISRMDAIVQMGYRVLYIWESDYRLWRKHGFFAKMPIQEHTIADSTVPLATPTIVPDQKETSESDL